MSIEGQGHFFTIYFPGFVCFMLYLDKISGERLQDHWSSGFSCPSDLSLQSYFPFQSFSFYYIVNLKKLVNKISQEPLEPGS